MSRKTRPKGEIITTLHNQLCSALIWYAIDRGLGAPPGDQTTHPEEILDWMLRKAAQQGEIHE